jgi:hypothetical protein
MSDSTVVEGSFSTQAEHALGQSPLEIAIAAFEGAATRFSLDAISDANARSSYMRNIRRISEQALEDAKAGRISSREAMEYCYEMRNKIMAEHRKFTSAQGLAAAELKKKDPPPISKLLDKYSQTNFNIDYDKLSESQKSKVHYSIVESSGRDNARVTKGTQRMRIIGKVGILVTATLATYEIVSADNKVKETARQGLIVGFGSLGGLVAALGISSICGPGAPVCAVALVLLGSTTGGIAGSLTADYMDEELEEFSKWEIF